MFMVSTYVRTYVRTTTTTTTTNNNNNTSQYAENLD